MVKVNFIATLIILQGFFFLYVQPWDFQYSYSYDNGNYNVSWMSNKTTEKLYFKVRVNATGYVGFGLAKDAPTNMSGYDIAVGGVSDNGSWYLQDYLTLSWTRPCVLVDLQQDWKGIYYSEESGVTILFFSRAQNTSDGNDTAVQEGVPLCIIWAYHSTIDVANDTADGFPMHTASGYDCDRILIPGTSSSTSSLPVSSSSSSASVSSSSVSASSSKMSSSSSSVSPSPGSSSSSSSSSVSNSQSSSSSSSASVSSSSVSASSSKMSSSSSSVSSSPGSSSSSSSSSVSKSQSSSSSSSASVSSSSVSAPSLKMSSSSSSVSPSPVQPWDFQYSSSYDNGNYNVSWMSNKTTEKLYFKVQVNATGYVGFGLAKDAPTNMSGYDIAVGGVYDNGSWYLQDYLTVSRTRPCVLVDIQQDWEEIDCSEENGVTILIFSRAQNTSDANDVFVQFAGSPVPVSHQ